MLKRFSIALLWLIFSFPALLYGQVNASDLVREWKMDAEETFSFLKSEFKNLIRTGQPKKNLQQILQDLEHPNMAINAIEKEFDQMKMTMEFFADGTFKSVIEGKIETGSWELTENNTILSTTNQDQIITKSTIIDLSPAKLILSVKAEGERLGINIVFVPNQSK